jgi:sulfide:quinone oxidoreductase
MMSPRSRHDVVIVGGGAAGLAAASSLRARAPRLDIALIEPADTHYYQPGWTMVGAGVFGPEQTRRQMEPLIPSGVRWLRTAASGFAPHEDRVILADGSDVSYRVLVAAPGIALDWGAIAGLSETLGANGVTSNYRFDLAQETFRLVNALSRGTALFTQPPMPIKCAGAPQKAMYLSCDIWRRRGVLGGIDVQFHTAGAVLFGVPAYVPALMDYVRAYGIHLHLTSRLVAVDGPRRIATVARMGADGAAVREERGFEFLHVVPPQVAPAFVRQSPLAGETGFIEVDHATLRHVRHANVFALGDACSAPNAKTAAAARKQAPVVAANVLDTLAGRAPGSVYDGYGSCPLTVERGRIILAEFGYGGKLLPSFPSWLIDGTRPSRLAWLLKREALPWLYWNAMLKGREWLARPQAASATPVARAT